MCKCVCKHVCVSVCVCVCVCVTNESFIGKPAHLIRVVYRITGITPMATPLKEMSFPSASRTSERMGWSLVSSSCICDVYYCECVCVMCVYHSACMEVRGQLSEVGSPSPWFLGTGLRLSDLRDNGLYTLSHFTCPLFVCLYYILILRQDLAA